MLGPFSTSNRGNKQIVVLTDYLSRWAECKALPDATAITVSKFFAEEVICRFGAPRKVLTDQGKNFMSALMEAVFKLFQVNHARTSAYHPACNGLTERFNRTLSAMLSMYVDKQHKNWDEVLPYVQFAYNTSIQASTGFSPFFLMFGREPNLPIESSLDQSTMGVDEARQYGLLLSTFIESKREIARNNIIESQEINRKHYDKNRRPVIYKPGDRVMVYWPRRFKGKATKLLHDYVGPYIVLDRIGITSYRVSKNADEPHKSMPVHVSRMKTYTERTTTKQDSETDILTNGYIPNDGSNDETTEPYISANTGSVKSDVPEGTTEAMSLDEIPVVAAPKHDTSHAPPNELDTSTEEDTTEPVLRRSVRNRRQPQRLQVLL